jgi:feruloyl esterase
MRLFVVPGMAHCGDGPGFSSFGQWYNGTNRPEEDVRAALVEWVERDRPPERIVATRRGESLWTDPRTTMESTSTLPSRPICAYPAGARWLGKGSTEDAGNFECVTPTGQ